MRQMRVREQFYTWSIHTHGLFRFFLISQRVSIHEPTLQGVLVEQNSFVEVLLGLRVFFEHELIHSEQMVGHVVLGIVLSHIGCTSIEISQKIFLDENFWVKKQIVEMEEVFFQYLLAKVKCLIYQILGEVTFGFLKYQVSVFLFIEFVENWIV